MDAISALVPKALEDADFVSGDTFFKLALEWRERPPIQILTTYREERREWWLGFIGHELNTGGSTFIHSHLACDIEVQGYKYEQ